METMEMVDCTAKGVNFVYGKEFVINTYGRETWDELLASMSWDSSKIWREELHLSELYPFSAFKDLISSLCELKGSDSCEENAEMYAFIAEKSLNSIYKLFFKIANPAFVIRNYPKLWQRFFTEGTVEVPVSHNGYAMISFCVPENFLDWLPSACYGYSKKAVEMAGGSAVRVRENFKSKMKDGTWSVFYEIFWED
ncbi:MAG: hypothetical protein AB7W47_16310 [Calditrichaceae bacterium]